MPKKKIEKPQREMTQRQASHWQRQNRIQRFTLIGGVIVILAVLIIVGTGLIMSKVVPYQAVVVKAGDAEYDLGYYTDMLNYYAKTQFAYYQQVYGQFGQTLTLESFLSMVSSSAPAAIEQNHFIKEAAAALNPPVTVPDDEVAAYIKDNSLPSNQAAKDAVYAQLLNDKLTEYFDKQVPESGEQRAVLAMFLESQKQIEDVKTQLAAAATFNDLAAKLSLETQSKTKNGDFLWVPQGVLPTILGNPEDTVLDNLVFNPATVKGELTQAEDTAQNKNLGYWILQVTEVQTATPTATPDSSATPTATPAVENKVHLMAMLLSSKEQADAIKAQLDNGTGDFITLAKANSQYGDLENSGWDLGLLSKSDLTTDFGETVANAIFAADGAVTLPTGKASDPISDTGVTTTGGFWLAQVTGIEANKKIEGDNRTTLTNNKKSDWEEQVWTDNKDKAQDLLNPDQSDLAIKDAVKRGV